MDRTELWEKCIAFHGHSCGGLAIGYKAALYVTETLGAGFSEDEELVCITENDACGVDAIQVMLGCSAGKGNLLFRLRGKQAFSFFDRAGGRKPVRLVLRETPPMPSPEERLRWFLDKEPEELFDIKDVKFELPEKARILKSVKCDSCGETAAETMIRLEDGKRLCLDCYHPYSRFC